MYRYVLMIPNLFQSCRGLNPDIPTPLGHMLPFRVIVVLLVYTKNGPAQLRTESHPQRARVDICALEE